MFKKMYEKVNCPGKKFKINQKLHDSTFDQSLLLLCNNETGKSELCHTCHVFVLIAALAVQYVQFLDFTRN